MELKDLAGKHMLDAVDFENQEIKTWGDEFEQCQVMRFRLDSICYTAIEDPSDGYRSNMRELFVEDNAVMKNSFKPLEVFGIHETKGNWGEKDDILKLIDVETGKTIIEVGTKNVSDYYPSFCAEFDPTAMAINQD